MTLSTTHTLPRSTLATVADHSATAQLGISITTHVAVASPDPGCVAVQHLQTLAVATSQRNPSPLSLRPGYPHHRDKKVLV